MRRAGRERIERPTFGFGKSGVNGMGSRWYGFIHRVINAVSENTFESEIPKHRKRGGKRKPFKVKQTCKKDIFGSEHWCCEYGYETRNRALQAIEGMKKSDTFHLYNFELIEG